MPFDCPSSCSLLFCYFYYIKVGVSGCSLHGLVFVMCKLNCNAIEDPSDQIACDEVLVDDGKKLGMNSVVTQNHSEWRRCLREDLSDKPTPR